MQFLLEVSMQLGTRGCIQPEREQIPRNIAPFEVKPEKLIGFLWGKVWSES